MTSARVSATPASSVDFAAGTEQETPRMGGMQQISMGLAGAVCGATGLASASRRRKRRGAAASGNAAVNLKTPAAFAGTKRGNFKSELHPQIQRQAVEAGELLQQFTAVMDAGITHPEAWQAAVQQVASELEELAALLGPPQAASAAETATAAAPPNDFWNSIKGYVYNPDLMYNKDGTVLLEPNGNPLPENPWTQFVAVQATLIQNLDKTIAGLGIPGSFGLAVASYTLLIRALLYPFVKGQLEVTAKIQVLAPRVNELKEKYKDNDERLQQEVGLLYMDLQIDPLGAIFPLLLQLPVFWGLYRGLRRLAIVKYDHLQEGFLWIPNLYGPNFKADPSFDWLTQWQGPLITLQPKFLSWEEWGLYAVLPTTIFLAYRQVMAEATAEKDSPKILQFFPFMLAFIASELPQALGIYFATNIASSVALTQYTKKAISDQIPGYDEFVKTGKWPPGVDPEKVLAKAFGVQRLSADGGEDFEDPATVPEAVFAGRADYIPKLLEEGKDIDQYDDKGISAAAYCVALNNADLLDRLFDLGSDPTKIDKKGNCLFHYCSGYGRPDFLDLLLARDGMKEMLNHANNDGQTCLDVARLNLSQERVCDDVRPVIALLKKAGAEGKTTVEEDEARFEEAREKAKKEEESQNARNMLMMMAKASTEQKEAAAKEKASQSTQEAQKIIETISVEAPPSEEKSTIPQFMGDSLNRVKKMTKEDLRAKLGDKLSEEQLEKIAKKLEDLSPEQLAIFTATSKIVTVEEANAAAAAAREAEREAENKMSVLVD